MSLGEMGLAVVLGLVLATVWYVLYSRAEQRRDSGYQAFCSTHGFQYYAIRRGEERQYVGAVPFFDKGHARLWQHEISGIYGGHPFTAFEYLYETYAGEPQHTSPAQ